MVLARVALSVAGETTRYTLDAAGNRTHVTETVGAWVVRQLLPQKAQKRMSLKSGGKSRNAQSKNLARLCAEFAAAGLPILSMDTKKKEFLGNLYREGHLYTLEELHTYDHDFPSYADGVIIPHSLYAAQRNVGYIH